MKFTTLAACAIALTLAGCSAADLPAQPTKQTQAAAAQQAANEVSFAGGNAEIENIKKRLTLTSQPGLLGFVVLLNDAGQPIEYDAVKGKITSSGKRLTPTQQRVHLDCGQYCNEALGEAPSDEGTYGHSDHYIYYWTTSGRYVQWSGQYLYSNQPFRLNVRPLVVDIESK